MDFLVKDFNAADLYFSHVGASEWFDLESIITVMPIFLQASDQKGKQGLPIFDPKASNEYLNAESRKRGWRMVGVPQSLTAFGLDWDAGKGATLAEWQFSNYPFLWNNIIRSEAIYKSKTQLPALNQIQALVIVTKSAAFPSSNSTLSFEQASAQIAVVTALEIFAMPIRLVGLMVPAGAATLDVRWSVYHGRYSRVATIKEPRRASVTWRDLRKHEAPSAAIELLDP